MLADFAQDVRHGLRAMRRHPSFTLVACLTLALGIGANTAIFSLVNVLFWRDLPVTHPEQLVQFSFQYPGDPPVSMFGADSYEDYRNRNQSFADILGTVPNRPLPAQIRIGTTSWSETINTEWVTGNFFSALGVGPSLGRALVPSDGVPGAPAVAVVSWSYWTSRLNADPGVLGMQLTVAGIPLQIVGVIDQAFDGVFTGYAPDVWIPLAVHPAANRATMSLMARLKEGVPIERARAEMRVLDRRRIEQAAQTDPQWANVRLDVESARFGFSTPVHTQFGGSVLAVMAIVGVLLLLTCTNVGSMLIARAAARQREMALRVSLGATRFRIVRQVLTESLLLSAAGALLGAVGAHFGCASIVRIVMSSRWVGPPPRLDVPMDTSVLLFTAASAVLATLLFGLGPAIAAFSLAPASSMKGSGGAGQPTAARRVGSGLVVAQVAVSVILLSVAGLYAEHLWKLRNENLGFDRSPVLVVKLDPGSNSSEREAVGSQYKELLRRLESIPGVRAATFSGMTPISGGAGSRFLDVDGPAEVPASRLRVMLNNIAPKYFETMGTPLVAGRDFQFADEGRGRVAIVNQALVRRYFGERNPLGRQIHLEGMSQPFEIVGVVADAKYADLRLPAPDTVYLNVFQQRNLPSTFAILTTLPPQTVAPEVRSAVSDVMKGATVTTLTLSDQLDASIVPERLVASLSGYMGGLGALLAAIGLYGLLAHMVVRRTSEIGVRMAVGATSSDVTGMVVKNAISLVAAGIVIGVPMGYVATRFAARILEGPPALSWLPLGGAAGIAIAVALAASYVPARRASKVDPLITLRSE